MVRPFIVRSGEYAKQCGVRVFVHTLGSLARHQAKPSVMERVISMISPTYCTAEAENAIGTNFTDQGLTLHENGKSRCTFDGCGTG